MGNTPRERWVAASLAAAANPMPVVEVGIPMRDGIELAADVYLPVESARPAPAIVTMTPYDKTVRYPELDESSFYQRNGYVFVAIDCRGRGKSEGQWRAFVNDGPDGHDAVEWVAQQPWCTGKVGTTGLSYMGWTQWATAAERPPHLTCMVSTSAAGRWHREIPYTDGCFQLYFAWWTFMVRRRISERYGFKQHNWDELLRGLPLEAIGSFVNGSGETWRDLMDHDTLDEHWLALRYDDRYARMNIPCLHVTGWFDLEDLPGEFHHYEGMVANSPARHHQHLLVGPWSHGNARRPDSRYAGVPFGPDAAVEMDEIHLRWFDHWLKGIENGVLKEPPVHLFETGTNVWRTGNVWPRSTHEESLYLRFDGENGSLTTAPAGGEDPSRSYRYDPLDPAPTQIDIMNYAIDEVPLDQTAVEARPDVLSYTSEPLTEEYVISGWAHLDLFASSDCDDTDWHVKITDVSPDGRSLKVCQGCRRASYRESLSHPSPLAPGQVHRFDVELWPVHHAFLPGHRIRLTITSSDFPWFARNLNHFGPLKFQSDHRVATNTIHHGETFASRLILPVERGEVS